MLAWLTALKSRSVQLLSAVVLTVAILFGVYRTGQRSTKGDIAEKSVEIVRTKAQIDEEVSRLSTAARRDELRKWSR